MGTRQRRSTKPPSGTTDHGVNQPPPPRLAASAFVFDDQHRLLVVQRGRPPGQGLWTVPGGKVRGGEPLARAVAREVGEETGLVIEVQDVLDVIERIGDEHGEPYHFVIIAHLATLSHRSEPRAGSDAAAAEFVELPALAKRPCTDGLTELAARALAALRAQ